MTQSAKTLGVPDWRNVNVQKLSDEDLTPTVTFNYLLHTSELITQVRRWEKHLSNDSVLTYEQYNEVSGLVEELFADFPQHRVVQNLLRLVVQRGIASLVVALSKEKNPTLVMDTNGEHPLRAWFMALHYLLRPGGYLGVNSHAITSAKSRHLIESMLPLAQHTKSLHVLNLIATNRFPGDESAQKMFVHKHLFKS